MSGCKGNKVYLRRDVKKYQEAWVFDAEDSDSFLGMAYTDSFNAPALAGTDMEKAQLKEAMSRKKRAARLEKAYLETRDEVMDREKVELMEKYASLVNEDRGYVPSADKPKVVEMVQTPMDNVTRQIEIEEQERSEEKIIPLREPKAKRELPTFWSEVLTKEEWYKKMGIPLPEEKAI